MVRMVIRSHQKLVVSSMYMDREHLRELSVLPILLLLTPVDITPISYCTVHIVDYSSGQDCYPYRLQ